MSALDIAILAAVAIGVAYAVRSMWKRRGRPCGSCGGCRACEGWRDEASRKADCPNRQDEPNP